MRDTEFEFYLRDDRTMLEFTGPQAGWFLDQLMTNSVEALNDRHAVESLLLTPKGRITAKARVIKADESFYLDCESESGRGLVEFFESRVFTTQVTIRDAGTEFSIVDLLGPESPVARLVARHPGAFGKVGPPADTTVAWVATGELKAFEKDLLDAGGVRLTRADFERSRVLRGDPSFGIDFDNTFLPQEAALERAVVFDKGCYLGQEAVAMAQRGRIPKRLRRIEFLGAGDLGEVLHEGDSVGQVTSVAEVGGKVIAIGAVKTKVAVGSSVVVVGTDGKRQEALVDDLPFATSGPAVPSARDLREKLEPA